MHELTTALCDHPDAGTSPHRRYPTRRPADPALLVAEGDDVTISNGRSNFTVRPLSFDDYPKLASPVNTSVTLPAAQFGDALRQVVRAASTDEARPILTGVMMTAEGDGLRMVATDSYRLAVRDLVG